MRLEDPVGKIKGVGPKREEQLKRLGIETAGDLLEHYPRDYDQYGDIVPVCNVQEGSVQVIEVTVAGNPELKRAKSLQIVSCIARDDTGGIKLIWFNMPFIRQYLKVGNHLLIRGKIQWKKGWFVVEQGKILSRQDYLNRRELLQPLYPLTFGLTNHAVTKAMTEVINETELGEDYLSARVRKDYGLMEYRKAVREIHFPRTRETMLEARRRLVFDEFYLFTLFLRELKGQKEKKKSLFPVTDFTASGELTESLPYELTGAQKRVWEEIRRDLSGGCQMNRLIQGDVGSGKTILAVLALLDNAKAGYQGGLMVPTEVLAAQHYETVTRMLEPFGVRTVLLVGSMTAKEKREACEQIASHEADIVVGTHALIQERVAYDCLSLVITDEQHRFGVRQRESFAEKGREPHVMVMSATPIPRTLAIILYGDLELSVIDELPANRLPIKNCVVDPRYRPTAYDFIRKQVQEGRQAYIICPMVEESETMDAENVAGYAEQLRFLYGTEIQVAGLHGRMKPAEKTEIMERFAAGEIQVLVSTTVVEVGVDVPNATVMMIENGERFGLAQLHQLRGRVGRGKYQSYCIIVSGTASKETKERLEILNHSNDGFYIAEQDLKLRGPGDLFGIRQSGVLEFRLGDIFNDASILKEANELAGKTPLEEFAAMKEKNPRLRLRSSRYQDHLAL